MSATIKTSKWQVFSWGGITNCPRALLRDLLTPSLFSLATSLPPSLNSRWSHPITLPSLSFRTCWNPFMTLNQGVLVKAKGSYRLKHFLKIRRQIIQSQKSRVSVQASDIQQFFVKFIKACYLIALFKWNLWCLKTNITREGLRWFYLIKYFTFFQMNQCYNKRFLI